MPDAAGGLSNFAASATFARHDPCLVAAAVRGGLLREALLPTESSSRLRIAAYTSYLGGASSIVLVNVYCPLENAPGAEAEVAALVMSALAWTAEQGALPVFICGDFNHAPLPSSAAGPLAVAGFRDLTAGLGPTTRPSHGAGRPIDKIFANRAAAALVRSVRLRWDLGLATHAAVQVTLQCGSPPMYLARVSSH